MNQAAAFSRRTSGASPACSPKPDARRLQSIVALPFLVAAAGRSFAQSTLDRQAFVDTFNAANKAYAAEQYAAAAPLYEQVVAANPNIPIAYLYLGNSYDHLSHNARGGMDDPALLRKAERNYRIAADRLLTIDQPDAQKSARTALEMLAALYGPDRLHDPAAAGRVVQELIRIAPTEPAYVFSLARLSEDAEAYAEAEAALAKAVEMRPDDAAVYALVAGHYWDIAAHGSRLTAVREREYLAKGLAAADRALALAPNQADAMIFKSQLLREQAAIETDRKKQEQLKRDADDLAAKARAIRGDAAPASTMPPSSGSTKPPR